MRYSTRPVENELILRIRLTDCVERPDGLYSTLVYRNYGTRHLGLSVQHPNDNYSRKRGLAIARGRCSKATALNEYIVRPDCAVTKVVFELELVTLIIFEALEPQLISQTIYIDSKDLNRILHEGHNSQVVLADRFKVKR